jgi:hypothetical protein
MATDLSVDQLLITQELYQRVQRAPDLSAELSAVLSKQPESAQPPAPDSTSTGRQVGISRAQENDNREHNLCNG